MDITLLLDYIFISYCDYLFMNRESCVRMDCPLDAVMSLIEGRWKTVNLCRMAHEKKPQRFKDFLNGIEGISSRMLSKQLREMEEDRLIDRTVYPEVPARVEYTLTDRAKSLLPLLAPLAQWGIDNLFTNSVDFSVQDMVSVSEPVSE